MEQLDFSARADVHPDDDASLPFVDQALKTALQSQDSNGKLVPFRVNAVREMARVMHMTPREFNETFRDAKNTVGERFAELWQEYRQYYLQPMAENVAVRARAEGFPTVLAHLQGDFGDKVLSIRAPPAAERGHWSSLDWNAWIVYELFQLTYKFSDGPLYGKDIKADMAYQIVWSLRTNHLYHDKEKKKAPQTPTQKEVGCIVQQSEKHLKGVVTNLFNPGTTPVCAVRRVGGQSCGEAIPAEPAPGAKGRAGGIRLSAAEVTAELEAIAEQVRELERRCRDDAEADANDADDGDDNGVVEADSDGEDDGDDEVHQHVEDYTHSAASRP
jgi:hypothetical protein